MRRIPSILIAILGLVPGVALAQTTPMQGDNLVINHLTHRIIGGDTCRV